MNLALSIEYERLGLPLPKTRELLVYRKLKCSNKNVHRFHEDAFPASPLYAMRFCNVKNSSHLLAVANEDGTVRVHDTRRDLDTNPVISFQAHYNAIFDLTWAENDVRLVTSSGDHTTLLWDLGTGGAIPLMRMVGHQGSVKAIACKPGDPHVFATGARDGVIMTWDTRLHCQDSPHDDSRHCTVKADQIIKFAHLKPVIRCKSVEKALENSQSVSSVVYQDETALISCSSTNKFIKIWDTRKTYSAFKGIPTPLHALERQTQSSTRVGYTCLVVSPCRLKLYAYCTDARVYAFNIGTYSSNPVVTYISSGASSFFCKINLSPDGRFLSSGSSDGKGYLWSVARPDSQLISLEGHEAEVTCVDWCKHGQLKLASCSDDGTYRIWTVEPKESDSHGGVATPGPEPTMKSVGKKYFQSHHANLKTRKRRRSSSQDVSPKKYERSPKKLCTPKKLEVFLSDLPNYNVDGRSPHEPKKIVTSPAPDDWLRRLIASTPPMKPTSAKKNRRPTSASKPSVRGSLLRYFKKTEEPIDEDRTPADLL